jgi:CO/xanthine dehydrogenase Mo-binding subunit
MSSPVTVRLDAAGRIELLTAMTDMGQGSIAVLPVLAAEGAGVGLDDVVLVDPDTAVVPDSGPTVASRTTMVVGGALVRAARALRERVLAWWGDRETLPFREVAARCFAEKGDMRLTVRHETPSWQVFDDATYTGVAYATYAWGADVVEVEVDPDTLETRVLEATAACEVGRVVHKALCVGQIEGGTLQAVGWATVEEMKLEEGRYLNDRLATYIIPTIKDAPRLDVVLLERPWEGAAFGAKGVGELPMDGGAPATVAAMENATGIAADEIPATPERLLAGSGR